MPLSLQLDRAAIAEFCRAYPIERLAIFGSILRDDFGPDSDVDFLVKYVPGAKVSLLDVAGMEIEFSQIIGRKADLRTAADLSQYFRNDVERSAHVIYERA